MLYALCVHERLTPRSRCSKIPQNAPLFMLCCQITSTWLPVPFGNSTLAPPAQFETAFPGLEFRGGGGHCCRTGHVPDPEQQADLAANIRRGGRLTRRPVRVTDLRKRTKNISLLNHTQKQTTFTPLYRHTKTNTFFVPLNRSPFFTRLNRLVKTNTQHQSAI